MRWLVALLLTGCASAGTPSMYLGHDCNGNERTVRFVEYESTTPGIDCPRIAAELGYDAETVALMVVAMPLGCALSTSRGSAVVVMPGAPASVRQHEYEHLVGRTHPALVPFYLGDGC